MRGHGDRAVERPDSGFRQGRQAQPGVDDADETLSPQSKYGLLLASAITTRNPIVTVAMEAAAGVVMTPAAVEAAKSAASVMAMNNVYYRFVHFVSNPEYKTMPARLRMNWLGNPRVDRAHFELWALAVSAINGCGACMDAQKRRCGKPAPARIQFKRPCALRRSCSQLRLRSRPHGMARRKGPSNPPFCTFRALFSGHGRRGSQYPRAEFAESALTTEYSSVGRLSPGARGDLSPPRDLLGRADNAAGIVAPHPNLNNTPYPPRG